MSLWVAFLMAFLCGFAVAFAAGHFAVWREGVPKRFRAPHIVPQRLLRSLALAMLAGPYFLLCEIRDSRREQALSDAWLVAGLAVCGLWMLATGIVILSASEQTKLLLAAA